MLLNTILDRHSKRSLGIVDVELRWIALEIDYVTAALSGFVHSTCVCNLVRESNTHGINNIQVLHTNAGVITG